MSHDGTMKMPFGKHKGKTIEELPSTYLAWMVENFSKQSKGDKSSVRKRNTEYLVDAADAELRFRDKHDTHKE